MSSYIIFILAPLSGHMVGKHFIPVWLLFLLPTISFTVRHFNFDVISLVYIYIFLPVLLLPNPEEITAKSNLEFFPVFSLRILQF